jgi:hypothetical protein
MGCDVISTDLTQAFFSARSYSQIRLLSVAVLTAEWCLFSHAGKAGRSRRQWQGCVSVASLTRIRHAGVELPVVGVATTLIFGVTNVLFRGFRPVPAVERYAAEDAVIFGQSPVATRCT